MTTDVDFEWFPGFSRSQKQQSIASLHRAAALELGFDDRLLLEISTKSPDGFGVQLSAFNLRISTADFGHTSVERAFQCSKVFRHAGYQGSLHEVEDLRMIKAAIREIDDELVGFRFEGVDWALDARPGFYDFLYLRALQEAGNSDPSFLLKLEGFQGFTDIEFNPKRSYNCQAWSCAFFLAIGGGTGVEMMPKDVAAAQSWLEKMRPDLGEPTHQRSLFDG